MAPSSPEMIRSAEICESATLVMLAVADVRTMLTPVISAMPTMRAAAVMAVRRGLRAELRRPSVPGVDQDSSPPITATTGLLINGVSRATPRKATRMPENTIHSTPLARPIPSSVPPVADSAAPATVGLVSGRSGVAASRIAATGAIREARTAGNTDAAIVTRMPTAKDETTAAAGSPMLASCRLPPPNVANSRASSAPTPTPAPSPTTEATTPITSASSTTDTIIWRRLAPMARISASSLVRCATMMEKVLKMMNAPTNRAIPAKPSRM